jgi:hypothetical protein
MAGLPDQGVVGGTQVNCPGSVGGCNAMLQPLPSPSAAPQSKVGRASFCEQGLALTYFPRLTSVAIGRAPS